MSHWEELSGKSESEIGFRTPSALGARRGGTRGEGTWAQPEARVQELPAPWAEGGGAAARGDSPVIIVLLLV